MFSVFLGRNRNTIAYNYNMNQCMIKQSFSTVKCFPEKFRWHLYLKGGGGGGGGTGDSEVSQYVSKQTAIAQKLYTRRG